MIVVIILRRLTTKGIPYMSETYIGDGDYYWIHIYT
jgi:hypothetical protein